MDSLKSLVGDNIYERFLEGNPHPVLEQLFVKPFDETVPIESRLKHLNHAAKELIERIEFRTADQIPPFSRLSTGCNSLDVALGGGIPVNGITEIYGSSGVGKTQIGLQLALTVQLPSRRGGLDRGALYICTDAVFPSKRLHELASHLKKNTHLEYEDNIYIEHIADYSQLKKLVFEKLPKLLVQEPIGLIVIDSIAGLFRSEDYIGNYRARGKQIVEIAACLHEICENYKIAIVCLNQVSHDIVEDRVKPALGLLWSNCITYRCCISKFESTTVRRFEIVFAPDLPNNRCSFLITPNGIVDSD